MTERNPGDLIRPEGGIIRVVKVHSGAVYAIDMYGGDQVMVHPNGVVMPGNGEVLNKLIAMKPLNQSLPDFLKELAEGDKKK